MELSSVLSSDLSENIEYFHKRLLQSSDMKIENYSFGHDYKCRGILLYCETMVQSLSRNFFHDALQNVSTDIVGSAQHINTEELIRYFEQEGASSHPFKLFDKAADIEEHILNGYIILLLDGWNKAAAFDAMSIETRKVDEPVSENVVLGPREGTVESLKMNLGLFRARLKSPDFVINRFTAGKSKKTEIAYGYLKNVADSEMIDEFEKRIASVKDKVILDSSYIAQMIRDSHVTPFPQVRYTERTDVAVSALLEGKIIVMIDGSGMVMICPGLFSELFQSSEDYYQQTLFSSLIRLMRIVAFLIAIALPGTYVALTTFHPDLVPTVLLLKLATTLEGIPFPAVFEVLIMEFFFELLREAGIRLPRPVGSAVSIVGALIIGEAAISAGIASPVVVVVVALTGIASFSLPQYNMAISVRILRFTFLMLSALLGGFGMLLGFLLLVLHLTKLRVLGQPYFAPAAPLRKSLFHDVLTRASYDYMIDPLDKKGK